ncbi:hypothetical protein SEA_POPPER_57 [Arthrobacter phage Popper]|uniref:Uncharacterized protein n=1 Tax=Arthrobacter phage Popper TaxID=2859633 RepID=A0AAE7WDV9_9CAUD|nr:hypothetical protein QEO78_gp49 [Arthrobacter phage Popper]QYC54974.1 hypothetical protein SEA_POPPER_57 [Arthrobacter phage Popper]
MTTIFDARRKPISLDLPTYPRISDTDIAVKTAWGFSTTQWLGFTDQQRVYYRENVSSAPAFEGGRE